MPIDPLAPEPADQDRWNAQVRTHLANERTFLAWLRTGITFVALGIAAAQLLDSARLGGIHIRTSLALTLVATGATIVVIGRLRYRRAAIGLNTGTYRPHRRGLDVVVLLTLAIVATALLFIMRSVD